MPRTESYLPSDTRASGDPGKDPGLSRTPLVPDVGVLAFVPDSWHWQWQPRHQVMSRLARYFPLVWVTPPEDWRQTFHGLRRGAVGETSPIAGTSLVVHSPSPLLPRFHSPRWLADFTARKRFKRASRILRDTGCQKVVLYLWRPEFADALDYIPADLSCYHIDDEYTFSPVDTPISDQESGLLSRVDQVFIHSPALLEKKGGFNPHTSFTPNGVDFNSYARPVPEPVDLESVPHPRVGYTGRIKRQLDWRLMRELTARHPEWSFVFVGALNPHSEILAEVRELSTRKNVWFLGEKSSEELAAYPQHFDVSLMPYVQDDYTKYIYPLKLHEYLAAGRPVVSTPIPSVLPFDKVVRLAATSKEWSKAIADSLAPDSNATEASAARQALARSFDWNLLVRRIARTIAERLGPPYAHLIPPERLEKTLLDPMRFEKECLRRF